VSVVLEKDGEDQYTDRVRNEEELQTVHDWNILHKIKLLKTNFIGHILRRNCLLKHVIEGKIEGRIEVRGRRERRCKQLLDHLNPYPANVENTVSS